MVTGKGLIRHQKRVEDEAKRQKALLEEAIEFEQRNRKIKRAY